MFVENVSIYCLPTKKERNTYIVRRFMIQMIRIQDRAYLLIFHRKVIEYCINIYLLKWMKMNLTQCTTEGQNTFKV